MLVKEFIELLKEEDKDRIVIMSSDREGNGHSPLSDISTAAYLPDSTWSGDIGLDRLESLTNELREDGYGKEDVITDGQKAIVLWPTN